MTMALDRLCLTLYLLLASSISSLSWASTILKDAAPLNATSSYKENHGSRKLLSHGYDIYFKNRCRYTIQVLVQAYLPHNVDTQYCANYVTTAGSWCTRGWFTLDPDETSGRLMESDPEYVFYYYARMRDSNEWFWKGDEFYQTYYGQDCTSGTSGCYGFQSVWPECDDCEFTQNLNCDNYVEPETPSCSSTYCCPSSQYYVDDCCICISDSAPAPAPSCSSTYCCPSSQYYGDPCCACISDSAPAPAPSCSSTYCCPNSQYYGDPCCNCIESPPPQLPPPPPPPQSQDGGTPVTTSSTSSSSSVNVGAIVGGVLGGLAAIALIIGGFFIWRNKRMQQHGSQNTVKTVDVFQEHPPTAPASLPPPAFLTGGSAGSGSATRDPFMTWLSDQANAATIDPTQFADIQPWILPYSEFQVIRPVGEGSFGRVFEAKYKGRSVALKVLMDKTTMDAAMTTNQAIAMNTPVMAKLRQEASLMAELSHANVVQFLGLCVVPPCIVTEFCEKGSLYDVLKRGNEDPAQAAQLTWSRRIGFAIDAAEGMSCLHNHQPPIVHRDLKSPNLLIDSFWSVKVSDFNLSKLIDDSSRSTNQHSMNPRWLSPELIKGERATPKADVFSFGVVMWEILTWTVPWGEAVNPWSIVNNLSTGKRLEIPPINELPGPGAQNFRGLHDYLKLMEKCWRQNPEDRPSFEEIVEELRSIHIQT